MKTVRALSRTALWTIIVFPVSVSVGMGLVMLGSSSIGYLPYSDRPGPGWFAQTHWPAWREVSTYLGFIPFFAYFGLFFGLGLFFIALALSFADVPRWLWRVIGAICGSMFAAIMIMAAGWYIALSSAGAYAGLALGLLYGLFLFPHAAIALQQKRPLWLRIATPLAATVLVGGYFLRPLLPHVPVPQLEIDSVRCNDAGPAPAVHLQKAWSDDSFVRQAGLDDHSCHLDSAGQTSSSGNGPAITLHLLFLSPASRILDVRIPTRGEALIILDGDSVRYIPEGVPLGKEKLRIHEDERGFSMKETGYGRINNWFWYRWTPRIAY